jgi:uncharacterized protein YegL
VDLLSSLQDIPIPWVKPVISRKKQYSEAGIEFYRPKIFYLSDGLAP